MVFRSQRRTLGLVTLGQVVLSPAKGVAAGRTHDYFGGAQMDWSALKAMPFGLVMFIGLVWGFFRRRARFRRAKDDYPTIAERMGLKFRAGSSSTQVGQLYGVLRGFPVLVDPDEQRKIIVRFNGAPAIDLRNYESPKRTSLLKYVTFRERIVNEYFKTRLAAPELIERLSQLDVSALIEPFTQRYRYEVKQLNVTTHGVTCVLDFGNPPHIPGAAIEALMPALLDWAEAIEPKASAPQ